MISSKRDFLRTAFFCSVLFLFSACVKTTDGDDDDDNGGGGSGGGSTTGNYWIRNDGQAIAYLSFSGNVAKSCANGVETTGTYNSSEPSMTFVVSGNTIKFPLKFSGNTLLVGVPQQAINTNTATQYIKSDNFPCGSGGGTGGGTTPSKPARGTFKVRVNKPTGDCASNPNWGTGSAFNGTIGTELYNSSGVYTGYQTLVSNYGPIGGSNTTYWDYTTSSSATKLTWDVSPNRSSWPTVCSKKGTATIDYEGQVKQVTITF